MTKLNVYLFIDHELSFKSNKGFYIYQFEQSDCHSGYISRYEQKVRYALLFVIYVVDIIILGVIMLVYGIRCYLLLKH